MLVDHLKQYLGHCINRCDHHILVDQFFAFPDLPSGNLVDAHPVFNNFLYVCVGHSTHTTRLPYILAKLMYLGRRAMHVRHHGAQKKFNLRQVPCSTQQVIEVPVCPPAFNFHHQTNAEFSLYWSDNTIRVSWVEQTWLLSSVRWFRAYNTWTLPAQQTHLSETWTR